MSAIFIRENLPKGKLTMMITEKSELWENKLEKNTNWTILRAKRKSIILSVRKKCLIFVPAYFLRLQNLLLLEHGRRKSPKFPTATKLGTNNAADRNESSHQHHHAPAAQRTVLHVAALAKYVDRDHAVCWLIVADSRQASVVVQSAGGGHPETGETNVTFDQRTIAHKKWLIVGQIGATRQWSASHAEVVVSATQMQRVRR
jgi:hypothetical protein